MRVKPFRSEDAARLLRDQAARYPGLIGVHMTDLFSGQTAGVNADSLFYGASTLKVPIAMAVLWLVDRNRLTLWETIEYRPEDFQAGTGTLHVTAKFGDRISVYRLLERMIVVSDNVARNMLERFIGSGTIRNYMTSIGVTPPYDPYDRLVTPRGMDRVLIALDTKRSGLSQASTQMLLRFMQQTIHRTRIPARMPPGTWVANKIGSWPWQFHDIGLVYAPDRSFAIAVFTKGLTESQGEEAIASIARAMYDYEDSLRQA